MLVKIQDILKKYNKDVWVMYNSDDSDKFFTKYVTNKLSTSTICFVTTNKIYLLVNELDKYNLSELEYDKEYIEVRMYSTNEELSALVEDIIALLKFPPDISLSYSTMGDNSVDILTHGDYVYVTKLLKKPYVKYSKKVRFNSAEKIIYEIASKKTLKQIERLKILADITQEILKKTFDSLKVGITEKQMVQLTVDITEDIMMDVIHNRKLGIIGYNLAWENCPIVLTGINLAKGGHSLPSEKKLARGDTIYFDFGIKGVFEDQEVLYSDMQRMGYALRKKEIKPPDSVMKVFNTLVDAIEDGIDEMKPNLKAYYVDNIVRSKITKAGFPDYNHATGHPVGGKVHDIGAIISLKQSKRAKLLLIENGVYTLEPRVNIQNGGSIEEMIQVTKFGGIPLCAPQKEIYLVK